VAASVARQENDFASGDFSGEQIVGRFAEGRFDFDPFLLGEAFDVIKSRAADDSDFVFRHGKFLTAKGAKDTKKAVKFIFVFLGWRKANYLVVCGHGTVSQNFENRH
jgi:hypothetical protein